MKVSAVFPRKVTTYSMSKVVQLDTVQLSSTALVFFYHIQLGQFWHGVGSDFPWEDTRDLSTAAVEPSNSKKCMMYSPCRQLHIKLDIYISELDSSTAAGAVWRSLLSSHGKSPPTPCRKWPNWIQYSCPAQLCFCTVSSWTTFDMEVVTFHGKTLETLMLLLLLLSHQILKNAWCTLGAHSYTLNLRCSGC